MWGPQRKPRGAFVQLYTDLDKQTLQPAARLEKTPAIPLIFHVGETKTKVPYGISQGCRLEAALAHTASSVPLRLSWLLPFKE